MVYISHELAGRYERLSISTAVQTALKIINKGFLTRLKRVYLLPLGWREPNRGLLFATCGLGKIYIVVNRKIYRLNKWQWNVHCDQPWGLCKTSSLWSLSLKYIISYVLKIAILTTTKLKSAPLCHTTLSLCPISVQMANVKLVKYISKTDLSS